MLTLKERKLICLKYEAWTDGSGNIFYFGTDNPRRVGKIYHSIKTGYYHIEDTNQKYLFEGNYNYEFQLKTLLKYEGFDAKPNDSFK